MRKIPLAGHDLLHMIRVLLNDAVCCKDYTATVSEELVNMEHWWSDTDRGNWSKAGHTFLLPLCCSSQMNWNGM
jgi:hypothetical protein